MFYKNDKMTKDQLDIKNSIEKIRFFFQFENF